MQIGNEKQLQQKSPAHLPGFFTSLSGRHHGRWKVANWLISTHVAMNEISSLTCTIPNKYSLSTFSLPKPKFIKKYTRPFATTNVHAIDRLFKIDEIILDCLYWLKTASELSMHPLEAALLESLRFLLAPLLFFGLARYSDSR